MGKWAKLVLGAVLLVSAAGAFAQKSANQCAKEIGKVANEEERIEKMMDCLGSHIPKPPKEPYYVRYVAVRVDSTGGVTASATLNNPNKESAIKYLSMDFRLFNGVGDEVGSTIGTIKGVKFVGPLTYRNEPRPVDWHQIAYNASAKCVQVTALTVEFMNGQTLTLNSGNVRIALHPSVKNDCSVTVR